MTASPTDAGMPGDVGLPSEEIEQTALLILQVLEAARERIYPDEESVARLGPHVGRIKARYGEIRGRSFSEAYQVSRVEFIRAAILSLIRPAFEAKEREKAAALGLVHGHAAVIAQLEAKLAQAVEAMEPFDDALGEDDEGYGGGLTVVMKWGACTDYSVTLQDLRDLREAARSASRGETP